MAPTLICDDDGPESAPEEMSGFEAGDLSWVSEVEGLSDGTVTVEDEDVPFQDGKDVLDDVDSGDAGNPTSEGTRFSRVNMNFPLLFE